MKGNDDNRGKKNDNPGIEAVGQIRGFEKKATVKGVAQADERQERQDVGRKKIGPVKARNPGGHMKSRENTPDHQLQGMGLHGQKSEKDQGVRPTGSGFSTHVGLGQHIGKQQFDTLGDSVHLKLRLSLNALHNQDQIFDPNEKQTEAADKGRRHDDRFYPVIYLHCLSH